MNKTYEGDVTAAACWTALAEKPDAFLIDVRSRAEWTFVGVPVLDAVGKETLLTEWQTYPTMAVDPDFTAKVDAAVKAAGGSADSELYFLCRSGARSMSSAAAMTAAGYQHCFNVLGGFEGPPNEEGHRGERAGWKADGLPWAQQ
ncbi:rhodanese-like domain-containing protein [Mangrovicella endophytica]|uniref:rhodanese-like domain-containing protein n=1 Tax=Mangrovicella endophytica TaxID=2066697 RepID=UPI000C9E46C9|nr:rhodanese-like domain-containing protein [Mangrovicella endophytica]